MKKLILAVAAVAAMFGTARGATLKWDANAAGAGQTDGAGAWLTGDSNVWWNGGANTTWTSGDNAIFGNGGAGGAVTLSGPTAVNSLTFDYFTGTYTLGSVGQEITLANGITKKAGPGAVTFSALSPIKLGGVQNWVNSSSANLGLGAVNLNGNALTFVANGTITFDGNVANVLSGAGGIIKNGTGSLILDGGTAITHTFSGGITVNGGRLAVQNGTNAWGRGNVTLSGGYIGARYGTTVTFAGGLGTDTNQVQILGGTSGFSGEGNVGSTFTIGTSGSTLKWGAAGENGATGYFNPSVLLLGGDQGMNVNGKGSLANGIDLNGANRTITSLQVTDGAAGSGQTVSGAIINSTGTGGLTKTGPGNLILSAANTYNGPTTINGGSITLSGSGTINSSSGLNLGGGTLRLVNTAQVNRFADGAGINSTAGGGIVYDNTSGTNVYTETLGSVTHTRSQLNIVEAVNQAGTGSQTLTLGGLSQSGSAAVTFSAASTGPQASGNKNMIVVTGGGSTTAGQIIGPWATAGTTTSNQTDYAVYNADYVVPANIAASAQSTWSTTHAAGSNYTLENGTGSAVNGRLTANRNVNSVRANSSTIALTSVDTGTDTITVTGHAYVNGDVVTFGGTPPAGLTSGQPYYIRDSAANTFKVSTTSGGAAVDLTGTGTGPNMTGGITLSSGNNLGTYGILNAQASGLAIGGSGTGVLTLPTTSAGNLYLTPGNGAVISIGVPIADNTGALTLVKNGSATLRLYTTNTYTGGTVINAGTLQIGVNGIANGAKLGGSGGNYAGDIFIAGGATLDVQTDAGQTLSGIISGDGSIVKRYSGTLTLSGTNNTYTGKTSITPLTTAGGGTLRVASFNSVSNPVASSSLGRPTTVANGTIDLGNGSVQGGATLQYTGSGETTDRVINFNMNGNGAGKTIDAGSGGGLLKFTSTPTFSGSVNNDITLQGASSGEFDGGLPLSFRNFTKSGNGTWTLGGAVGSTGLLTVNAGTLALQKKSSLMGGNMANWTAAKINVKSAATLALNVDSADIDGLSSASLDALLAAISVAGSATAGLQSGAILGLDTSSATGGSFTQGTVIANSTGANGGAIGLKKLGAGTLVLDKTNTYSGATTVGNGTLLVTGSIFTNAVTVQGGGVLGGTGLILGPTTVNAAGTLAPGTSAGTLTISNSLTVAGITLMEIDATNLFDRVVGIGALTYGGALTLDFGATFGPNTTNTWDLFDFASQSANFVSVSLTNQYSGSLTNNNGTWSRADGDNTWVFNKDDGTLVLTVIPEPGTLSTLGALFGLLLLRRDQLRRG
ncbi:MAG: hypothetical protein FJ221_10510 [Lentisphaerae bacterium]|nr:hypothetical protein [Lentisphaerota bacterium]